MNCPEYDKVKNSCLVGDGQWMALKKTFVVIAPENLLYLILTCTVSIQILPSDKDLEQSKCHQVSVFYTYSTTSYHNGLSISLSLSFSFSLSLSLFLLLSASLSHCLSITLSPSPPLFSLPVFLLLLIVVFLLNSTY